MTIQNSLATDELRGRIRAEEKAVARVTVEAVPFELPFDEARRGARGSRNHPPRRLLAEAARWHVRALYGSVSLKLTPLY